MSDIIQTETTTEAPTPEMIALLPLIGVMLKVGATGFGMGMIGVLQQEVVARKNWLNKEEFADGVAVANLLPGPIAVDVAVYVGYKLRGWLGATLCLLSLLIPAFFIMLTFTILYLKYGQKPQFDGVFQGINAAVIALVLSVAWRIGKQSVKNAIQVGLLVVAFAAGLIAYLKIADISLVIIVLASGIIGLIFMASQSQKPAGQGKEGGK
jgi:chromate transporter